MVNVIIKDPRAKAGFVLKTQFLEDAFTLIQTLYDNCIEFRECSVTIEWDEVEAVC